MPEYDGVCTFHSETGTEGGYWAFQDDKHMGLAPPNQWRCSTCGRIWDKTHDAEEPKASFTYWIDRDVLTPEQNPKRCMRGYYCFDAPQDGETLTDPATGYEFPVSEGPNDLDRAFTHATNEEARLCYARGHGPWESPQEQHPDGMWSYEGLHILGDGDHLTIFDKQDPARVVWEGVVELRQHPLFTNDAFGMWIHADQVGVNREIWADYFLENYPAHLSTSN